PSAVPWGDGVDCPRNPPAYGLCRVGAAFAANDPTRPPLVKRAPVRGSVERRKVSPCLGDTSHLVVTCGYSESLPPFPGTVPETGTNGKGNGVRQSGD